jgi:hypothetical protein
MMNLPGFRSVIGLVVTLPHPDRRRLAGSIFSVALRLLASAAALALVALHPYLPGEWFDIQGEPALAANWFRCTPAWLVSHERLDGLRVDADVASFEQELTTGGARVRFDPLVWRVAGAMRMGRMADASRVRTAELFGRELPPVNVRLPRWEDDCLLGAFDYLDVNLSPAAGRNPLVVAHEVTHFAWFHSHLARPGLPVSSPLWLEEGLAEYSAAEAAGPALMRRLRQRPTLRAASLEALDRQVAFDNDYREATGFVRFLVESQGPEAFRAFVRAMRLGTPTWEALGRGFGQWPEDLLESYARGWAGSGDQADERRDRAGTERPLGGAVLTHEQVLRQEERHAKDTPRLVLSTDRRLPPLWSTLLVSLLIVCGWAAGRRWPGLAAGRVLRCWAPALALASLLANR